MLFEVQVHERSGWTVLSPVGELDLASAPRLRQVALRALDDGATRLVVDLAGVDFLDSLGAGVLVAVRKRVAARRGELCLARPEPQVARVLALAGVDRLVEVLDDLAQLDDLAGRVDGNGSALPGQPRQPGPAEPDVAGARRA